MSFINGSHPAIPGIYSHHTKMRVKTTEPGASHNLKKQYGLMSRSSPFLSACGQVYVRRNTLIKHDAGSVMARPALLKKIVISDD